MAIYRLEIWFDFDKEKCDWGIAQASNTADSTPFQSGGTPVTKNGTKVNLTQAANQPFDIYLFDKTGNDAGRQLQWFALDYEQAPVVAPGQNTRDPLPVAESLRQGVTGATFSGARLGAAGTTDQVGVENNIFCAGNVLANRRWSLDQGYNQNLTAGNYSFTIAFVIGSPTEGKVKGFTIDPEMDIQN